MASDPKPSASLLELLARDAQHARDLNAAVTMLSRQLPRGGVPYAVIGAVALRLHGFARFTEVLDLLTTPEGLERISERYVGGQLLPTFHGRGRRLFLPRFKVAVTVRLSGDSVGSPASPLIFPHPDSDGFEDREGIRVPSLSLLIAFKLTSGVWGSRFKDLGDVQELIKRHALGSDFESQLIEPLREHYRRVFDAAQREVDPETGLS